VTAPLFSVRAAAKRYELGETEVVALAGVDLDIGAGEFVAIAGPSGSGKSTLLHLLGALDSPDGGSVAIEGRDLATLSERERTLLRRRRLGFVFQSFHLVPVLSALENVEYPLWIDDVPAGRPEPWMIFRVMEALRVYPPSSVVKVGDTLVDIEDGLNAGVWSVGVVDSSNLMGLTGEEFRALSDSERDERRAKVREAYRAAGAHAAVDTLAELPSLCS
jgi:ABC-type sugar transport system ATPase subunit